MKSIIKKYILFIGWLLCLSFDDKPIEEYFKLHYPETYNKYMNK